MIHSPDSTKSPMPRRQFVTSVVAAVASSAVMTLPGSSAAAAFAAPSQAMTIQGVIDLILKSVPGTPISQTVDTIKAGDPNQPVKGIVTTMFATIEVIRKAITLGANFIIAHEPTFYNHADDTAWLQQDEVYKYKWDLLQKNKIVVWRFHDAIHMHKPDGVLSGILTAMGWQKYYDEKVPYLVTIPALSLQQVITLVKSKLAIEHVRYIGDKTQSCSRIVIAPGSAGGTRQIGALQQKKPDLLICGELNEWETSEYVRDLRASGSNTSLIVLGHIVSEEPGLEWLVQWLQPQLPGIKITHIPSKDAFSWA